MRKINKAAVLIIMQLTVMAALLTSTIAANADGAQSYQASFVAPPPQVWFDKTDHVSSAVDFTVGSYAQLTRVIAEQGVKRDETFTIRYNASLEQIKKELSENNHLWLDVCSVDLPGTTSDLDYLYGNVSWIAYSGWWNGDYAVYEFTITYLTTGAQENYIDSTVDGLLNGFGIETASQYEKVKAVHDYILYHVEYDTTLSKHSAYDALHDGTAVCQGYTLLTYKMLLEAGVPTRFIIGNSGDHVWNIVKLGEYWYNLDVTWDDTARTSEYFLKSNASFTDHMRNSEFKTAAFNAEHPMSPSNFDPSQDVLMYDPAQLSSWALDGVASLIGHGVVPASMQSSYQGGITRAEFTALIVAIYEYAKGPYTLQNATPFNDISGSIYAEQIAKGYELGLINGVGTDAFDPEGTLTREQCAKIISAAAGVVNGEAIASDAALPFGDKATINDWALTFVRYAYENGLMNGTGANFEPQGLLTREQAMLIAERMIVKYGWQAHPPAQ